MTVFELIKGMTLEQTADLLSACFDVPDGCEECIAKAAGFCGYPELDCMESMEQLLRSDKTGIITDSLYSMNRAFGNLTGETWIRKEQGNE